MGAKLLKVDFLAPLWPYFSLGLKGSTVFYRLGSLDLLRSFNSCFFCFKVFGSF